MRHKNALSNYLFDRMAANLVEERKSGIDEDRWLLKRIMRGWFVLSVIREIDTIAIVRL